MSNSENKEMTFEEAMKRIGQIMELLDSKKTTLEESVALYTESMELIAGCSKKLAEAEAKIKVITLTGEKELEE